MIIAQITAGMGNQLFQYAAARNFAEKYGHDLKLDMTFFETWKDPDVFRLDKFKTHYEIASTDEIESLKRIEYPRNRIDIRILNKFKRRRLYENNKNHVDSKTFLFDKKKFHKFHKVNNIYLSGCWADEKYFIEYQDVIREEFTLNESLNAANEEMKSKIVNSNSVSLHFRLGDDYVKNPFFADVPLDYYTTGIKYIAEHQRKIKIFIFSNDLQWVKKNLKVDYEIEYVDINGSKTDFMELSLMSYCKHNIIANSTFSWWGAWLNRNNEKNVIAPKKWFNNKEAQNKYESGNLVPASWKKI